MRVQIQLVHAEAGRRVVQASAMEQGECLAASLGEGDSAEVAEDRARARLRQQLQPREVQAKTAPAAVEATPSHVAASPEPLEEPATASMAVSVSIADPDDEPAADPDDWSSELAQLDLQLKRLGWTRDQESSYLLRTFGHSSRARLTRYSDLVAYINALGALSAGADPQSCAVPLRRSDLLQQSDQLLSQLGWHAARGRLLLDGHFSCSSRQQLNDAQLLEFNMLLEAEVLNSAAAAG